MMKYIRALIGLIFIFNVSLAQDNTHGVDLISGSFITFQFQDLRNKYMNPADINQSPLFWETKLKEYRDMGLDCIIIQFVSNEGKAFYPSAFLPHAYPEGQESPVSAILHASDTLGIKVFLAAGWAYDQYDDTRKSGTRDMMVKMMKDMAAIYKDDKSFYGWYIPAEADLSQIISSKTMVKDINLLSTAAKKIMPKKKVMISPYGIWNAPISDPRFAAQIKKLKVDIIAYQDEVGCVREPFPIPKMKDNFKLVSRITREAGIALWSNIESFTWSDKPNNHYSALIPAPFGRYLSQISGATQNGADKLVSFAVFGIMDDPKSDMPLGQPVNSARFYNDYMEWKDGKGRWPLLERTFKGKVPNLATGKSVHFYTKPSSKDNEGNLTDDVFGVENSHDSSWLRFDKGRMVFEVDLDSVTEIHSVALRLLHYRPANILSPKEVDCYLSKDGINYWKAGTVQPNPLTYDHLDCWIDLAFLDQLNESARFVKVVVGGDKGSRIFCDEIMIQ